MCGLIYQSPKGNQMKNMRSPGGKFGAASSVSGAPNTPARLGRTPPGITGESGSGSRVKVSAECGREIDRSAAHDSSGKRNMKSSYAD
jgi:hypothetical protein